MRVDAERFPRADLGGAGGAGARPGARGTAGRLWRERGRRACGTWVEVFGEDEWAQEVFMAWGFASYCGALAAAGARHLDVPFHVNAWLGPQPGQDLPGRYPSGGPVAGVVDVWKAAAPALALLGPDIYVDDVKAAVAGYVREDNALLVPESRPAAGNLLWAVGRGVIGFNVFGVDDVRADGRLAATYRLLAGAEEVIIAAQRSGRIRPVLLEAGQTAVVGLTWTLCGSGEVLRSMFLDTGVQVRTEAGAGEPETTDEALVAAPADTRATAVLVDLGDDELLAIGQRLMFEVAGAPGEVVEIDDAVEQSDVIQARHASQIHELAAPGGQGRINALAPLDIRLAQWRCGRGAHRGRGRRFRGGLGRARCRGQGPQVSGETPSARGLIRSDRGSSTLALILPEGSIAPLAAEGEERRRHTLKI